MGEGPGAGGGGMMERWSSGGMDPAEGRDSGGSVPSLVGRAQLDRGEGWRQLEDTSRRRRRPRDSEDGLRR